MKKLAIILLGLFPLVLSSCLKEEEDYFDQIHHKNNNYLFYLYKLVDLLFELEYFVHLNLSHRINNHLLIFLFEYLT